MNLNNVLTRNYVKWTLGEREKNEAKTKPNEAKLKKAEMSLTLYITRAYENKPRFQINENEAKTKPKQTQTNPISKVAAGFQRDTAELAHGDLNGILGQILGSQNSGNKCFISAVKSYNTTPAFNLYRWFIDETEF